MDIFSMDSAEMTTHTPPYMSYSRMKLFGQCRRKYFYKYIEELPDPSGEAAEMGVFIHEVLEEFYGYPPEKRTVELVQVIAAKQWELHPIYTQVSPETRIRLKRAIWPRIVNLWQIEDPTDVDAISTEADVTSTIDGIDMRAIIDRVDDPDKLNDYKSGKFHQEHLDQMNFYAAVYQHFNYDPQPARLLYLQHGKLNEFTSKPDNQKAIVQKALDTYETIVSLDSANIKDWKPTVNHLCDWCSFQDQCPAYQTKQPTVIRQAIKDARKHLITGETE